MAVLSDYVSGTITLTSGSDDFTGTGTGWQLAQIREGDTIFDLPGTPYQGVILSVTSNVAGKLTKEWEGPDLTDVAYRIRIMSDGSRATSQSAMLREQLGNGNIQALAGLTGSNQQVPMFTGPGAMTLVPKGDFINGVAVDKRVNDLAERAAYDGQAEGFSVYVANVGDGRAATYFKQTAASGDWSDPAYVTGPIGETPEVTIGTVTTGAPGTDAEVTATPTVDGVELDFTIPAGEGFVFEGAYNGGTAYAIGDVVRDAGSSWIALQPTTGNAPPTLPTTSNAYWELLAQKGSDGAGTGDVVGPASSVDSRMAEFSGTTGKLLKDSGVVVSAFAKTVLDDADAAAVRTTIGAINKAGDTGIGALALTGTLSVAGLLTNPGRPYFQGNASVSTATNAAMKLDTTVINNGISYDNSGAGSGTRIFAPVAGIYEVVYSLVSPSGSTNFQTQLFKNGAAVAGALTYSAYGLLTTVNRRLISLAAGDYLEARATSGASQGNASIENFAMHLIG